MPRYTNLDGTTPDKGFADLLKWQIGDRLAGRRRKDPGGFVTPARGNDGAALAASSPHMTWIGHATYALRLAGKTIVTDPVWSAHVGMQRRNVAPGVALERMPRIDVVTISHSHYDHLDLPTLRRIARDVGRDALFVVPKDVGEILRGAGLLRVVELGWWETHREGDLRVTLVPAQHWSMRVPWDRNKRLWGGFVVESEEGVAYHAGDTAYSERVFAEIAARFPKLDWAMLPIGAYEPTWFMQSQHMGPEEAVRAFEVLGAHTFCAMHWGTFKLTDEPMGEPPERVRARWAELGLAPERLAVFDAGETRAL